jgi:hypothetical protein
MKIEVRLRVGLVMPGGIPVDHDPAEWNRIGAGREVENSLFVTHALVSRITPIAVSIEAPAGGVGTSGQLRFSFEGAFPREYLSREPDPDSAQQHCGSEKPGRENSRHGSMLLC